MCVRLDTQFIFHLFEKNIYFSVLNYGIYWTSTNEKYNSYI